MMNIFYKVILSVFVIFCNLIIAISAPDTSVTIDELAKYDSMRKRDPFVPVITNEGVITNIKDEIGGDSTLMLEGIMYDDKGQSLAIVNGEVVRKDDMIADAKVLEIKKESVVFIKNGEIFVLESNPEGGVNEK